MKKMGIAAALAVAVCAPHAAHAFCGFYINGAGTEMFNNATEVVLLRSGTRTVLSMQNNYQGPPQDFAMVIPVPVVLHEGDVQTLTKDVFTKVDQMGAPRLVEYWEQDPCGAGLEEEQMYAPMSAMAGAGGDMLQDKKDYGVKIEAQFTVGEYQIVILSAKDSTGLDAWLRDSHYQIPKGAEPLLRPYVESGSKFFVAKVDPKKVHFENGMAMLSPLRFHYDADEFSLPIRLGLANSSGTQDLIVNILSPGQRYELANYKNVTIPTNLDVKDDVRKRFGEFYAALFDRTVERNPGAVVTEYSWAAMTCDPCPGPNLDYHDFATLGADVLDPQAPRTNGWGGNSFDLVLTRLHARYGKDIKDDLVFREATPIVGGREIRGPSGELEHGSSPADMNNFQGRYAIRHEWTGPLRCEKPIRHRWGGPPAEITQLADQGVMAATNLAFAPRGKVALPDLVAQDVPEIGVKVGTVTQESSTSSISSSKPRRSGCGCQSTTPGSSGVLVVAVLLVYRRKRSP